MEAVFPFSFDDARPVSLADVDFDVSDLARFTSYIDDRRGDALALYGGYGEERGVYAASSLFDGEGEPRTIHLGVDVWTEAGTAVRAPLDGVVHGVAINDAFGDYGGTVVLRHDAFFTLWGHLAHRELLTLREGQVVAAGTAFARLGTPDENGGWPPHLHLQQIIDMQGRRSDFPGVASRSARDVWLALCPDPTPLLGRRSTH